MEAVKTDLKTSQSEFRIKAGAELEVEKLREAIVKAGFTPTWIRFEAVGRLILREGSLAFKVRGTDQVIPLLADEKLKELQKALGADGKLVFIVGLIPKGKKTAKIEAFEIR